MVQETGLTQRREGPVVVREPQPLPMVTQQTIENTVANIRLLQGMVKDLLKRGVDYGRTPGTQSDNLWDPGASQIIGAFGARIGPRRILKLEDTDEKIAVVLEAPLISRSTGDEVAAGIGAASTLETKYKYRWVNDPLEWGYDAETIKTLKHKIQSGKTLYRIPNPEHSDLLNTIVKMASKRAEVDAAQTLPGVASVLRQMFDPRLREPIHTEPEGAAEIEKWAKFWGEVRRLGYEPDAARAKLGVKSMKDWLAKGKTIEDAIAALRPLRQDAEPTPEPSDIDIDEDWGKKMPSAGASQGEVKLKRDPTTIRSINELYQACNQDFKMQPKEVLKELGVSSLNDLIETPADCYRRIAVVRPGD